jgi:hypothetical protein
MVIHAEATADKSRAKREKEERKRDKERRDNLKSRSDWIKEAQVAFNAWIRWRDRDRPCISCGRYHDGAHDAGHYRTTGSSPAIRFNEDNCHKQCVPCNQHKHGNIVEYRLRLIERIGRDRVEALEVDPPPAHWSIDDIKAIRDLYRKKLRDEKKGG